MYRVNTTPPPPLKTKKKKKKKNKYDTFSSYEVMLNLTVKPEHTRGHENLNITAVGGGRSSPPHLLFKFLYPIIIGECSPRFSVSEDACLDALYYVSRCSTCTGIVEIPERGLYYNVC